ncbi:MAG TPA: hypothetical protein VFR47_14620 [Anaerolineales bacterium]|nr:hypothetical protein [Anaerolineales bacterium]
MSWFVPPAKYRGKNAPCRGLYQGKEAILAGEEFINDVPVSFVALLTPAYNDLLILFSGYGFFLHSSCEPASARVEI